VGNYFASEYFKTLESCIQKEALNQKPDFFYFIATASFFKTTLFFNGLFSYIAI
jgi:hypothetical protein